MEAIKEYGISLGWVVCFLLLAIVARYLFDWIAPILLSAVIVGAMNYSVGG